MQSEAMMRPVREDELAAVIREAATPLWVRGGGTRGGGGGAAVLETGGMSGIRLYEPGALTLVAGAGTPLAEVEAALAAEGQRLAFEPMDHRGLLGTEGSPTLGGMVAMNVSGPRRVQVGACRDHLLGLRFVDGSGAVISNGGRVMKNVTGYDLVRLMAGARGALGVLTEVSLKVLPAPEAEATLMLEALELAPAVAAMSAALGSPYEVSGAARLSDGRVALRLEGLAVQVSHRSAALARHLARHGVAQMLEWDKSRALWQGLRDVAAFHGLAGDVWRISCRPSEAAALAARAGGAVLLDWGGALIWVLRPEGGDLRADLGAFAGHATRIRAMAADGIPDLPPEPAAVAVLSRGLKQRFDPRGILNPGTQA